MESRLELSDTIIDMGVKLADGNPGAARTMMECYSISAIDPENAWGNAAIFVALDSHGIYGPRIWMLYKDVCDHNAIGMLALLRAVQLGIITQEKLDIAIDNRGQDIDVEYVVVLVKERLPSFGG